MLFASSRFKAFARAISLATGLLFSPKIMAANLSFAIIGDAGKITSSAKSVQSSIRRAGVQNLILPGDNLYESTYENVWKSWSGLDFSVVAIGNHNGGYKKEIDFFKMPSEYYSQEFAGGLRFLVLNSDNTKNVASQMKWLEGELQKEAPMTFLVWHHPSYTFTSAHKWEEKAQFQIAARSLMHRYSTNITAVLFGHDHIAAFYCANEIPIIISGAVQETRIPETKNYKANDATEISAKWVLPPNTPTWARLDIDMENLSVNVSYVRASDNKVMFSTKLDEANKSSICRP